MGSIQEKVIKIEDYLRRSQLKILGRFVVIIALQNKLFELRRLCLQTMDEQVFCARLFTDSKQFEMVVTDTERTVSWVASRVMLMKHLEKIDPNQPCRIAGYLIAAEEDLRQETGNPVATLTLLQAQATLDKVHTLSGQRAY